MCYAAQNQPHQKGEKGNLLFFLPYLTLCMYVCICKKSPKLSVCRSTRWNFKKKKKKKKKKYADENGIFDDRVTNGEGVSNCSLEGAGGALGGNTRCVPV